MTDITPYKENHKTSFLAGEFERLEKQENELDEMAKDPNMKELAEGDLVEIRNQKNALLKQMEDIVNADKAEDEWPSEIVLEVRAGAGGEEAALFAEELSMMYGKYAEWKGWSFRRLDESRSALGGFKEAAFEIRGKEVYK